MKPTRKAKALHTQLKQELGIDVINYHNQEAVENFAQLLVLPKYVITWLARPLMIAAAAYVTGFFVLDLVHIEYFIYALIGAVLFLLNGLFFGMLLLSWKMKSDVMGILNYSLDVMKSAISDLNQVKARTSKKSRKQVLGLLFQGIVHVVTIPTVSKVLADRVPFFGRLVHRFIQRILTWVANRVSFDMPSMPTNTDESVNDSASIEKYLQAITHASGKLDRIVSLAFNVARLPFKVAAGTSFVLLALLLLLVH